MEHLERQSGGIIGVKFNNASKKVLSFVLSFASGLMMAIVCFDLIPEALKVSDFGIVIVRNCIWNSCNGCKRYNSTKQNK